MQALLFFARPRLRLRLCRLVDHAADRGEIAVEAGEFSDLYAGANVERLAGDVVAKAKLRHKDQGRCAAG